MTEAEEALVERLREVAGRLTQQHRRLRQRNDHLLRALEQSERRRTELELQCRELSARHADLKIAKAMELSENDARAAHRRFTNLVRQVDECIAMLKS